MDQHNIANHASIHFIDEIVELLEGSSCLIGKWFSDNRFQRNASKCYVLLSTD